MEKRKVFKISIIDKEISRTEFDRNTFYTSDSELSLVFKLIEKDYTYDHGEILLYNENDKSFVTRPITKKENDFVYELDLDIIPHYGKWRAQLQLVKDGDVYTSKPFEFNIVNDLSNLAPQPTLTDINNWATLKQSANELIDEMQDVIVDFESVELERVSKENNRQQAESQRVSEEIYRKKAESERENNEKKRRIAEFERVDKETARQQAESQRQSTFETKEIERQTTFETAELTREQAESSRESAELIRVENENQRVLSYENMQETIDMIGKVKLVNDIDVSITANGDREITKNPELNKADDNISEYLKNKIVNGDKYYISIEFKSKGDSGSMYFYSGGGSDLHFVNAITTDEYQFKSKIVTGITNFALVRIVNITGRPQATDLVYRKVYTINLTQTFGAGKEPTKEVMDWIILENGYFEELILRRYDIQQYEITQLRKAVIALGGTI